jgi:cytochrome b subunit of formate dehydrogenase
MGAVWTRRILHIAHVILSLVLIATGLVIEFPELRARLVGGYGMQILQVHLWLGWAFMAAPALALAPP